MSHDFKYEFSSVDPGLTPREASDDSQPQDVPPREHPETMGETEPNIFPGSTPNFFPYIQYPSLTWQPRVDIFENHDNFLVVIEVPGVDPKQLNVENASNLLVISGNSLPAMSGSSTMIPCHQERLCGGFSRSITLPFYAEIDQAEATYKHGLLEITVPKRGLVTGQSGQGQGIQ